MRRMDRGGILRTGVTEVNTQRGSFLNYGRLVKNRPRTLHTFSSTRTWFSPAVAPSPARLPPTATSRPAISKESHTAARRARRRRPTASSRGSFFSSTSLNFPESTLRARILSGLGMFSGMENWCSSPGITSSQVTFSGKFSLASLVPTLTGTARPRTRART